MNIIRLIIKSLIFLCLFYCPTETGASPVSKPLKDSEESFIDAILKYKFAGIISAGIISDDTPLVINEKLSISNMLTANNMEKFTRKLIQEAKQLKSKKLVEAVRDLCAKNSTACSIKALGHLNIKYVMLTEDKNKVIFKDRTNGWEMFEQVYPKSPGIIELSRPGFSKDGTVAIIYFGQYDGGKNIGSGQLDVFEKKNGEWVASKIKLGPAWIS